MWYCKFLGYFLNFNNDKLLQIKLIKLYKFCLWTVNDIISSRIVDIIWEHDCLNIQYLHKNILFYNFIFIYYADWWNELRIEERIYRFWCCITDAIGSLKKRAAPLPPGAPHPRSTPSPSADAARSIHGICTYRYLNSLTSELTPSAWCLEATPRYVFFTHTSLRHDLASLFFPDHLLKNYTYYLPTCFFISLHYLSLSI